MAALIENVKEFFSSIIKNFSGITVIDVIDILLVTVVLYLAFKFIRDRRAGKLIVGIVILALIKLACDYFGLTAMNFILRIIFQNGLLAIVIIFQPELRSLLEVVADPLRNLKLGIGEQKTIQDAEVLVEALRDACCDLAKEKTGALIVIERDTKLGEIIASGVKIDSAPSSELIENIFFKNSPLHDGALVIRQNRLYSAGCFLPLSTNEKVSRELGTRHRAAIGMSEVSDALVLIVSEERGTISVAQGGKITRDYDYTTLYTLLNDMIIKPLRKDKNTQRRKKSRDGKRKSKSDAREVVFPESADEPKGGEQ